MIAKQPATPVATGAVTDWFWNGHAGKPDGHAGKAGLSSNRHRKRCLSGMASLVGAAESAP
jgi:hypothetical protein